MNNAVFMYNNSKLDLGNVINKVSVLPTSGIPDGDKYWYIIDDNLYVYNELTKSWTVIIPVDGMKFFLKSTGVRYEYYSNSWRVQKAGDASSVNGYTLGKDVPSDAIFTDTIYDDTEIKKEIQDLQNTGSHSHDNKAYIDKIGEDASGNVTYNGTVIQTTVPTATTLKLGVIKPDGTTTTIDDDGTLHAVSESGGTNNYVDLTNKPSINGVELSDNKTLAELSIQPSGDYALKNELPTIASVSQLGLVKPDGVTTSVDTNGIIHAIGGSGGTSSGNLFQKTYLNVLANSELNIENHESGIELNKAIIQVYKFIAGNSDVVKIIKEFNNTEVSNFYYNTDNVEFISDMKIKDKYNLQKTLNSDSVYETETINKIDLEDVYRIEVTN